MSHLPTTAGPSNANRLSPLQWLSTKSLSWVSSKSNPVSPSTTLESGDDNRSASAASEEEEDEKRMTMQEIRAAAKLTWQRQRRHLFTSWIHVPLGVLFLLVVSWALRLAINEAPFRFPAPVIAMMLFFVLLLALEWLSAAYPGKSDAVSDAEKGQTEAGTNDHQAKPRRFIDPVMKLLAPPCEFCLRNMSVMFTPSFVLIPAREVLPGREIGLIAAWFLVTQILGFLFPVLLSWVVEWTVSTGFKAVKRPIQKGFCRVTGRPEPATSDEKIGTAGSMGALATGLSGMTANILAPISHVPRAIDADAWRQIESTAIETARQQGEPAISMSPTRPGLRRAASFTYQDYAPRSDVSGFEHHHHQRRRRPRSADRGRQRSTSGERRQLRAKPQRTMSCRTMSTPGGYGATSAPSTATEARPSLRPKRRPSTADSAYKVDPDLFDPAFAALLQRKRPSVVREVEENDTTRRNSLEQDPNVRTALASQPESSTEKEVVGVSPTDAQSKALLLRHALGSYTMGTGRPADSTQGKTDVPAETKEEEEDDDEEEDCGEVGNENDEESSVERLSSWFSDLLTPFAYFLLFLVGIPLFFLVDIALPLFLGINILTFIAAITIVPPKIRRFLHPILSCSISTVLIIWAFAAMKGIGLKDCLNRFYSIDAKYTEVWSPMGYNGSVPGAGDLLFSTLDAGIIALAVPMFRYRKELRENFIRMATVLTPCAALSLFFWNWIAALMGMDQTRALAFTARFMSTPLAIELANNIGADESITVILVVITGIVAAILKDHFFRLMRVDREDYLIIGITMGSTSGAIGASSLISTPRVMAVASLSFVIFGSILLIATAIPPIVTIVRSLA